MKNIAKKIIFIAVILALVLALSSCEAVIDGITNKINNATCELFGHSIVLYGYKAPTCTEAGYSADGICEICGFVESYGKPLAPIDHEWVEASCSAPKTCSYCGLTEGEALPHTLVDKEALAPTCTEAGHTAYKECACGYVEGKEVVAAAHTWSQPNVNGTISCSACHLTVVKNNAGLVEAMAAANDGSTIILEEGDYGSVSLINPSSYKVKNLTLEGEKNVVIHGISFNNWNPVESSIKIEGLTIRNITFDTNGLGLNTVSMSDVTVENCKFINDARILQGDINEKLTNLVVKDCEFTGAGAPEITALMLENTENLTVTGCTFTNISFNVLQMNVIKGTVLFDANIINGTGDRVFRFVAIDAEADITISNNTITSNGDDDGELAKSSQACEIKFDGNVWNGLFDEEVADKLINITIKK